MQQTKKPFITAQPARIDTKLSNSMLPLGKVIYVGDTGKLSDLVATRLHIESQVSKCHNIFSSKATLVCQQGRKSGLGIDT